MDVEVRIRALGGSGGAIPYADSIGIIDTGADKVLVPRGIAKRLGLKPINHTRAILASGEVRPAVTYMGLMEIPAIGYSQPLEMTAMTDGAEANHILLGRNFLREFLVTIDCANGVCWFNKPTRSAWQMVDDE